MFRSLTVVLGGQIQATYSGPQANAKLTGLVLSMTPGLDANQDVIWVCGTSATPAGVTLGDGTNAGVTTATTVPAAYLPNSCHV